MFKLMNLYNKSGLIIHIEYGKAFVDFDISTVINKRNKDDLNPERQFLLLNAYLDYKGDEFKKKLMNQYIKTEDILIGLINRKDINPLPVEIAHPILDMFDYNDVLYFVSEVYKVQPPEGLKTEFNTTIETDGDGTRAQTYLKTDYLELAALITILKTVLGPIGHFSQLKHALINGVNKEYILFNFIVTHRIFETPPMQKLYAFTKTLVDIAFKNEEVASIRVIERRIAREEMPLYILASAIFARIITNSVVDDKDGDNVITKIHVFITNKLNVRKDVSSAIRNKQALSSSDGSEGDRDSIVESYRVVTALSVGDVVEMEWSVEDIDIVMSQLNIDVDKNIVNDAIIHNKIFLEKSITQAQLVILCYIFKDVLDPRSLKHLSNVHINNLLSVGFAYLWRLDCKYLAILLNSLADDSVDDDVFVINSSTNRSRLSKEIKDELNVYYPYTRVINKETTANVAEEAINLLSNLIYSTKWLPIVGEKYALEVAESRSMLKIVPNNLKILLAEMIIKIEENRR